jgi:hypothetical protein
VPVVVAPPVPPVPVVVVPPVPPVPVVVPPLVLLELMVVEPLLVVMVAPPVPEALLVAPPVPAPPGPPLTVDEQARTGRSASPRRFREVMSLRCAPVHGIHRRGRARREAGPGGRVG